MSHLPPSGQDHNAHAPFPLPPHLAAIQKENDFLLSNLIRNREMRQVSRIWRTAELLFAAVCGAGFAWAFPDGGFSLLGWVGLIPLLMLTCTVTPRRAALNGYVWGFCWALISFGWFRDIWIGFPLITALVLGCFPMLFSGCLPFLFHYLTIPYAARREGHQAVQLAMIRTNPWKETLFCIAAASLWVTTEWIRSWIATGLPWNTLATTQWQNAALLQVCEYTGFYGMSFLIAMINIALFLAIRSVWRLITTGQYIRILPLTISAFTVVFVLIATGKSGQEWARPTPETSSDPADIKARAGVIQTNIPISWGVPVNDKYGLLRQIINQTLFLAKSQHPQFILWPETAVPIAYSTSPEYQKQIRHLTALIRTPLLIGTADINFKPALQTYNSVLLFNEKGELKDRYDKVHTVPFGEFIPFGTILDRFFPDLRKQFVLPQDLTPGRQFNPLEAAPDIRLGVNICFEDVFPYISREFVRNGANVLVTVTNDAWYPTTDERVQHLANSVFRAVENRRFLIRTGNMTRACLIDPAGQIVRWFGDEDKLPFDGMVCANGSACFEFHIPRTPYKTFYTRYGDVFAVGCAVLSGLFILWCLWQWRMLKVWLTQARNPLEKENSTPSPQV